MIFVTVGGQIPFDRLIRSIDEWAGARNRTDVFAQIGQSEFRPRNIRWTEFLSPEEFRRTVQAADALVGHAGMGSIITALEFGKPILVMPRLGDLRETRNDHQVEAARHFQARGCVDVASNNEELWLQLDSLDSVSERAGISGVASPEFIDALRAFINAS